MREAHERCTCHLTWMTKYMGRPKLATKLRSQDVELNNEYSAIYHCEH